VFSVQKNTFYTCKCGKPFVFQKNILVVTYPKIEKIVKEKIIKL